MLVRSRSLVVLTGIASATVFLAACADDAPASIEPMPPVVAVDPATDSLRSAPEPLAAQEDVAEEAAPAPAPAPVAAPPSPAASAAPSPVAPPPVAPPAEDTHTMDDGTTMDGMDMHGHDMDDMPMDHSGHDGGDR